MKYVCVFRYYILTLAEVMNNKETKKYPTHYISRYYFTVDGELIVIF